MSVYKFIVGVVLALAMIAVLGLSALVFSARDFQYGLQELSPRTGGLISFAALSDANEAIDAAMNDSSGARGTFNQLANQLAALDEQTGGASQETDALRAQMVGLIAQVERSAGVAAPSAAGDLSAQALSNRIGALVTRSNLDPADQQRLAQLQGQLQQLVAKEEALDGFAVRRAALVAQQQQVTWQVDEAERRVLALQATVVPETDQYNRIRGEAAALHNLSPLGVSASLAQGHPALLSTILVLLMGSLGSLLYLFPAYLNRAAPVTVAEILVRLIFGMCASLAFYVLANAAIASFAITSAAPEETAGTSATLNPFTVSLIGIVAGVMSEDIAKWIQERGRGILQQGGGGAAAAYEEASPGGGLVNNQAIS